MVKWSNRKDILVWMVMCAQIVLVPSLVASNIFGSVTDSLQQAVDVATVSLFRTTDSTFIKAEYTSTDGTFEFMEIPAGTYYGS